MPLVFGYSGCCVSDLQLIHAAVLISLFYYHSGTQESICSPPLWEGFWPLEGSGGMDFSLVKSSVEQPLGRHRADPCF